MDYDGIWTILLRLLLVSLIVISSFTLTAQAACECGYQVGSSRYTHAIVTNFFQMLNIDDISDGSGNELNDWEVQEWATNNSVQPTDATFVKQNDPENVWIADGMLHMRQRAFTSEDEEEENSVSIAEIVTRRDDILYGSFRAKFAIKVEEDTDGGSVAGFFFYHGDASETDIEILTRNDESKVHYSQQPTYNYETDEFYEDASLTDELTIPWTEQQEYRWDWHPDVTYFYQDKQRAAELRVNVPRRKGKIMINIWADGGQWSGPPANKDIIMQIQYIELFFNTSMSHGGGDPDFIAACEAAGGLGNENATCIVETEDPPPKNAAPRLQNWLTNKLLKWAFAGFILYFAFCC